MNTKKSLRIAALLLVLITLFTCLVSCGDGGYNFAKNKMKKFIQLSKESYDGITVKIDPKEEITSKEVEEYILDLRRYYAKSETLTSGVVQDGDTVKIYYWGEIDGTPFFGGSNMADEKPYELLIGGGNFIPGFEDNLIGVDMSTTGIVYLTGNPLTVGEEDRILHISYTGKYTNKDGQIKSGTISERIDLDSDTRFSSTFKALFLGKRLGETIAGTHTESLDMTGTGEKVSVEITGLKVTKIVKSETMTEVEATFPADYGVEALNGKTATFHVAVTEISRPVLPDLNESFLKDTLKLKLVDLLPYIPEETSENASEGAKMLAAFPHYMEEYLKENAESVYESAKKAAMWDAISKAAKVLEYPEEAVTEAYNSYYAQAESMYQSYASQDQNFTASYPTILSFISAYYGESYPQYFQNKTAEAGLKELARASVKEQMVFYYIVQTEKISLTRKEKTEDYDALVQNYADYFTAQYGTEITKEDILKQYTKDYLLEEILYNKVTDLLAAKLKVEHNAPAQEDGD